MIHKVRRPRASNRATQDQQLVIVKSSALRKNKRYILQPKDCPEQLPVGVTGDRVPPLVLIDVDTLDISLCVNVICAAGQSLEETSSIAPRVDPGSVVIANAPNYPNTVALNNAEVASDLTPEPEQRKYTLYDG